MCKFGKGHKKNITSVSRRGGGGGSACQCSHTLCFFCFQYYKPICLAQGSPGFFFVYSQLLIYYVLQFVWPSRSQLFPLISSQLSFARFCSNVPQKLLQSVSCGKQIWKYIYQSFIRKPKVNFQKHSLWINYAIPANTMYTKYVHCSANIS